MGVVLVCLSKGCVDRKHFTQCLYMCGIMNECTSLRQAVCHTPSHRVARPWELCIRPIDMRRHRVQLTSLHILPVTTPKSVLSHWSVHVRLADCNKLRSACMHHQNGHHQLRSLGSDTDMRYSYVYGMDNPYLYSCKRQKVSSSHSKATYHHVRHHCL